MDTIITGNIEQIAPSTQNDTQDGNVLTRAVRAFLAVAFVQRELANVRYLGQCLASVRDAAVRLAEAATHAEAHADTVAHQEDPEGDRDIHHTFGRLATLLVVLVDFIPATVAIMYLGGDELATAGFTGILVFVTAGCIWMTTKPRWRAISVFSLGVLVVLMGILRYLTFTVVDGDAVPAVVQAFALTAFTGLLVLIGGHFVRHTQTKRMSDAADAAVRARRASDKAAAEVARTEKLYATLRDDLLTRARIIVLQNVDDQHEIERTVDYIERLLISA